jgi:hypothetical protein
VSAKYLLPCRCGQTVTIESRQAGETVTCVCGETLSVPTMLGIIALEAAPDASSQQSANRWEWRQRLLMLGAVMLVAAVIAAIWLYKTRPISITELIDPEMVRQKVGEWPPALSWKIWELRKLGLDRQTDRAYEAALVRFHVWETTAAIVAVIGLVLVALGIATKRRAVAADHVPDRQQL